nr:beta-propeller fold lactonase family protein [Acidobacteriota bacterium]
MKYKKNDFNRRDFLTTIGGAALLSLANFGDVRAAENKNVKEMLVYIGTYTSGKSKSEGIYIYKLNLLIGELKPYKTIKNVVEPSFLAIDKQHRYLYAVNETEKFEGKNSGAISAFVINQTDG